jgi:hypothetical protein
MVYVWQSPLLRKVAGPGATKVLSTSTIVIVVEEGINNAEESLVLMGGRRMLGWVDVFAGRACWATGRDKELSFLHDQLSGAKAAGERGTCAVYSMTGVGKTQLVLEYAYRYRAEFDFMFWLPAEYGPRLAQVFATSRWPFPPGLIRAIHPRLLCRILLAAWRLVF